MSFPHFMHAVRRPLQHAPVPINPTCWEGVGERQKRLLCGTGRIDFIVTAARHYWDNEAEAREILQTLLYQIMMVSIHPSHALPRRQWEVAIW